MCTHLGNKRTVESLRQAIFKQIACYRSQAFSIGRILSDGEGAVMALEPKLNDVGIKVERAGPGEHVPVIERKIRQIKERVRGSSY